MTGQYPRRRESDAAARRRVEELDRRRREWLKDAPRLPAHIARAIRPRISASGRLV